MGFFKVGNEDESFKSSLREFHILIDVGIQDFYEKLVRLQGTVIFLLFLKG